MSTIKMEKNMFTYNNLPNNLVKNFKYIMCASWIVSGIKIVFLSKRRKEFLTITLVKI